MNPHELANELDKSRTEPHTSEYLVGKAANMLRQQAEKIRNLEKQIESIEAWRRG